MKRTLLLMLALIVLLLAAAFLLLDFRFQQAEMAVDSTASTYSFSIGEKTPLPLEQSLDLYVQGPPELEDELAEALSAKLATNPYVGEINLHEHEVPPAPGADSVLIVAIEQPSTLFWSPLYARTTMTVDVAYASDGEVDWIDEDVVRLSNEGVPEPVVRIEGEYAFDGSAYGLISGPGYAHYLAEEVAQTVNQSLADTIASQGRS